MAVVKARTSPPYALIAFVILWVISTGLAVWLYTQQSDLKRQAEVAQAKLPEYVKPSEEQRADAIRKGAKDTSAFGALMAQRDRAVAQITGANPGSELTAVDKAIADATQARKDAELTLSAVSHITASKPSGKEMDSLISAVKQLRAFVSKADEQIGALQAQVNKGNLDLATERENNKRLVKEAEGVGEGLKEQVAKLEEELRKANAKLPELQAAKDAELAKRTADWEARERELLLKGSQKDADIVQLRKEIVVLNRKLIEGRGTIAKGMPDEASGKVIRAAQVDGQVSIGIGSADRVVRGMTFVVFDAKTGVRTTAEESMGKGAIEVLQVGEHEALCRITRQGRNQRIEKGDVVFNLVHAATKNRRYSFAVYGDFDTDRDGIPTGAERERVKRMILEWGGKNAAILDIPIQDLRDANYQPVMEKDKEGKPTDKVARGPVIRPETDFVILGTEPNDPSVDLKNVEAVGADQVNELRGRISEFKFVENQAMQAGATVLNTNRFLNLIGYYNTTLVRN